MRACSRETLLSLSTATSCLWSRPIVVDYTPPTCNAPRSVVAADYDVANKLQSGVFYFNETNRSMICQLKKSSVMAYQLPMDAVITSLLHSMAGITNTI